MYKLYVGESQTIINYGVYSLNKGHDLRDIFVENTPPPQKKKKNHHIRSTNHTDDKYYTIYINIEIN